MAGGRKNFTFEQGAVFERTVYKMLADRVTPDSLAGYDARMQIRDGNDSPTVLVALTSNPAAGLTITAAAGRVDIRIGADVTAVLPIDSDLVYDLELVDQGDATEVVRLLYGRFQAKWQEVTR